MSRFAIRLREFRPIHPVAGGFYEPEGDNVTSLLSDICEALSEEGPLASS